jgi:outer membrane protein assembly factor BamB
MSRGDDEQYRVVRRRSLAPPSRAVARRRQLLALSGVVAVVVALLGLVVALVGGDDGRAGSPDPAAAARPDPGGDDGGAADDGEPAEPADPSQVPAERVEGQLVNPASSGRMWSEEVPGVLTFRGNPTRTYYGRGPVPSAPKVKWFTPADGGMCSSSSVGGTARTWCGMGWTGQPAVFERDGRTWVVFGAYDAAVHFLDGDTGEELLPPLQTDDIIKGSATVDPDGYPLVYIGSRDNFYRVIAIDRPGRAEVLWKLSADAVSPTLWNDDWDGSGLVLDDLLLEGGENSQFHVAKLNRGYGSDGLVTVDPQLVFNTPSWDEQVIADLAGNRAREMSVENSVAVSGNVAYFANSGGLVSGWDLGPLVEGTGRPERTLRFWTGDDTDATIVIDDEGFLYVSVEYERGNARAAEVGQLMKLDPRRPDDPLVWSFEDRATTPAGFWATPALHRDVLISATNGGELLALDRGDGTKLWSIDLPGPTWQSPVVVDDVLVYGDCNGVLRGYDVSDPRVEPPLLWEVRLGGCIEATPVVWKGTIYVGTRGGRFFALTDDGTLTSPTAELTGGGGD